MYRSNTQPLRYLFLTILILVNWTYSTVVLSKVDKSSLTVGDRVTFQVTAIVPKGAKVTPPSIDKEIGNIVIKEWNSHKSEQEKVDSVTFSYLLTTFVPERCTIPSLPFLVETDKKVDTLYSQVIPLEVQSVLTSDTVDLKDLKSQQISGNPPLWWVWLLLSAIILIIGIIIIKRLITKKPQVSQEIPKLPPYEEAIAALKELERKKYLERGLIREYVFEISEILKRYIERRFNVNASEFTTEEMVAWLGISDLEKPTRDSVEWFFRTSDPIKFARYIPEEPTLDRFTKTTYDFINATRPLLENSSKNQNSNDGKTALHNTNADPAVQNANTDLVFKEHVKSSSGEQK